MKTLFPGYYRPANEVLERMFRECIFVFDTNTLLNLYRLTPAASKEFINVISSVKDRIWIPHHVAFEYHQNRIDAIIGQQSIYRDFSESLKGAMRSIEKDHRNAKGFLSAELIDYVATALNEIQDELARREAAHPDWLSDDPILEIVTGLFNDKVGSPYDEQQNKTKLKDAKDRFEMKIPPGYEDRGKQGDRKYGDAIVWFQILDHAAVVKEPIVFITDDSKKDWWLKTGGKTLGPRPELIQEFNKITRGKSFYMYSTEMFLDYSVKLLNAVVNPATIEEAKQLRSEQMPPTCQLPSCGKAAWLFTPYCHEHLYEVFDNLPEDALNQAFNKMHDILKTLTYREREIIKLLYGIGDGHSYTVEECARIFKVTPSRLRQIARRAVRKLQHPVRSRMFKELLDSLMGG